MPEEPTTTVSTRREAKRIARHAAVYGAGNFLQRAVSFVMIPVYTRYLVPADYGGVQLVNVVVDVVGIITGIGISSALFRFYFDSDDPRQRNATVSTAVYTFAVPAALLVGGLAAASGPLSTLVFGRPDYATFFLLALAAIWFNALYDLGLTYLRIRERSGLFLLASVGRLTLALALNIYFIVGRGMKAEGIFLSTLITAIVFAAIVLLPILARVGLAFWPRRAREMLAFGAPLIPSELAGYIVHSSGRIFIEKLCPDGQALTGIYSLGYKLGNVVHLFVTSPFIQIWQTRRFAIWQDSRSHEIFARIFTWFVAGIAFASLAASLGARDALRSMAHPSYWGAEGIVPWIAFGFAILGTYYHFQFGILVRKKTAYLSLINGTVAAFNLVANFLLIPRIGIQGAAIAALLSFSLKVAINFAVSRRLYPLPLEWSRLVRIAAAAGVTLALGWRIRPESIPASIAGRAGALALYPLLLWVTGFLRPEEREAIASLPGRARGLLAPRRGS